MAIYGYDKYGSPSTYGAQAFAGSGFDLSPINIAETGYGIVTLQWRAPDSNVSYSRIRLVRSTSGFPIDENDGANVRETTSTAPSSLHTDTGLTQGRYYYYSFFVETDVPTYSSTDVYTRGQVAKSVGGTVYVSLVDRNAGNAQTDTNYWYPTTLTKRWILAGRAVILATKRYDFTTRLYQSVPPYYRSGEVDWEEPAEASKTALALATYPPLAKFLSIFGNALDGIQTRSEAALSLHDASRTPAWYLSVLADHTGRPLEGAVSARQQRVRLSNAALLDRSKGTRIGVQDEATASLGYDTVVTVGTNKMLDWDRADARHPRWPDWDSAAAYVIGDRVTYGAGFYRAIADNRGTAQGPPNGGSNTWWTQMSNEAVTNYPLNRRYRAVGGWVPADRSLSSIDVLTASLHPVDSVPGNTFRIQNTSGGAATVEAKLPDAMYLPAWSSATSYYRDDMVTYSGSVWRARKDSLNVSPDADPTYWIQYISPVPSGVDPQAVHENGVPVTPGVSWTASVYVASPAATVNANILIDWYTGAGVFISTSTGTASALATGFARRTVSATSPANAKFAIVRVSAASLPAGGAMWFRAVQIEQAAAATTWVPPRRVEVLVRPDRINHVTNPSFETNTTGWTAQGTSVALSQDATQFRTGTKSLKVNAGAAGTTVTSAYTETVAGSVTSGEVWTAQAWIRRGQGGQSQRITIGFYTAANALIGSVVVGTSAVPSNTAFQQYTVSAVAPATASYLRLTIGDISQAVALNDHYFIDSVMIEKTDLVRPYFDGGFAGQEYLWAGTAHASKSYYYQGLSQKRYRLGDIISRSIPHGVPYSTRYAEV